MTGWDAPEEWLELLATSTRPAGASSNAAGRPLVEPPTTRVDVWQALLHGYKHTSIVKLRCRGCSRLLDEIRGASGGITSQKHGGGTPPLGTAVLESNRNADSWNYTCLGRTCRARHSVNTDRLAAAYIRALRANVTSLIPGAPSFGLPAALR